MYDNKVFKWRDCLFHHLDTLDPGASKRRPQAVANGLVEVAYYKIVDWLKCRFENFRDVKVGRVQPDMEPQSYTVLENTF